MLLRVQHALDDGAGNGRDVSARFQLHPASTSHKLAGVAGLAERTLNGKLSAGGSPVDG